MIKGQRSFKIIVRYTLLQLPALALVIGFLVFLQKWVIIPPWLHWGMIIVWAAKDMVLFPFVWRAYDWDQKDAGHAMIGMQGVALEPLDPAGFILVRGERWRAEVRGMGTFIKKGQKVEVRGIQGLTLYVKPLDQTIDS